MLEAKEINRRAVAENVVWLARNFDEEIDEVKRQSDFEFMEGDEDKDNTPR